MKVFAHLRAFGLLALMALSPVFIPAADAQTSVYQLLSNAGASGPVINPSAGSYLLTFSGTFGGATLTLTETQSIGGGTKTFGPWTSAPDQPCIPVPAGASVQMTVSGGSPSGLYAILGGTGGSSCSSGASGGGPITAASGAIVDLGAQADAVCSTDTGLCSLVALVKRLNQIADAIGVSNPSPNTPSRKSALTNSVVSIISSQAAIFDWYHCSNPNGSAIYLQVFDVATAGAVSLGSTAPTLSLRFEANAAANISRAGLTFINGIQVAITTTATGSTAPGTAADCNFGYR